MQIARVFATDIDFHSDLRKGDRFSVIYEMVYEAGELVAPGRILAAQFVNDGRVYHAVLFRDDEGSDGYYSLDGSNRAKAFLRSPVEFSRVSSGFGTRFHPIFNNWRAHTGVDFAAPRGTRVLATADGPSSSAGSRGGYGNAVEIRHGGGINTLYAHLSGSRAASVPAPVSPGTAHRLRRRDGLCDGPAPSLRVQGRRHPPGSAARRTSEGGAGARSPSRGFPRDRRRIAREARPGELRCLRPFRVIRGVTLRRLDVGTSLDGADAALVDFSPRRRARSRSHGSLSAALRERILSLSEPGRIRSSSRDAFPSSSRISTRARWKRARRRRRVTRCRRRDRLPRADGTPSPGPRLHDPAERSRSASPSAPESTWSRTSAAATWRRAARARRSSPRSTRPCSAIRGGRAPS
jgi:hypothetical protein